MHEAPDPGSQMEIPADMNVSVANMAYEVLLRAWRPMNSGQLRAGIRALCAATCDAGRLAAALDADKRFARNAAGCYGLDEFRGPAPGGFSYINPAAIT